MKLLLTSGGVTNPSIEAALLRLLGRPIGDCTALLVPTAQWGQPACSPQSVWRTTAARWDGQRDLVELGWRSVGVLELAVLPSLDAERWQRWVSEADVLLVDGGEAVFLAHWLRASGLADLFPTLTDTVWVGVSAGSMALTPRIGAAFCDWRPDGSDETLGLVGFSIFPHLDHPGWESNSLERARAWARSIGGPAYAIDDQSALVVDPSDGGVAEVVSEGRWEQFGLG